MRAASVRQLCDEADDRCDGRGLGFPVRGGRAGCMICHKVGAACYPEIAIGPHKWFLSGVYGRVSRAMQIPHVGPTHEWHQLSRKPKWYPSLRSIPSVISWINIDIYK